MTTPAPELSRRERQIMDVIYERGRASAAEVRDRLPDAPSYSAVRALLRVLEEKGHLRHRADGQRYIYMPVLSPEKAKAWALQRLLRTFFHDSTEQAVAALIDLGSGELGDNELARIGKLIDEAKRKEAAR
jgi:BlaI family penicillinase repressor